MGVISSSVSKLQTAGELFGFFGKKRWCIARHRCRGAFGRALDRWRSNLARAIHLHDVLASLQFSSLASDQASRTSLACVLADRV